MKQLKNKYLLNVEGYEYQMINGLEISLEEFKKQRKNLENLTTSTIENETPVESWTTITKGTGHTTTDYFYQTATTTIILTHIQAKEGYRLLRKSEMKG